ncbi:MAG: hypothetical protein KC503_11795 [Myxococcales bacterium]|nr:hypothetical protein [Myxococcales bacterium]
MHDAGNKPDKKKKKRKLLLPAVLAVSLLTGGAGLMTACGDSDTKPDTVSQLDKGAEAQVADAGMDAPDLVV